MEKIETINVRIDYDNTEEILSTLEKQGCVVVKSVLSQEEVKKTKDLYWQWAENLGTGIDRNKQDTWIDDNWPGLDSGITIAAYMNQSKASWNVRATPKVKDTFAKIWKDDDLLVSYDSTIIWRPWWQQPKNEYWKPYNFGLHLDQNPNKRKGLHCIQGMVPMLPVNEKTGGLAVVPKSHLQQEEMAKRYKHNHDFVQLIYNDPFQGQAKLIEAEPGDLILWDGRTVHAGIEGSGGYETEDLARLSFVVCMTPKKMASQQTLLKRRQAFDKGIGTNHYPHEFSPCGDNNYKFINVKHDPVEETEHITNLIGMEKQQK